MAVTGFWPVYGNLKATLDYADNPDKTTSKEYLDKDLYSALRYAENDNKTDRRVFVGGINCSKQNAYTEMIAVQRRFGMKGKVVAYHGIQSFKADEVTPEEAFEIGKETARRILLCIMRIIKSLTYEKPHDRSRQAPHKMQSYCHRFNRETGINQIAYMVNRHGNNCDQLQMIRIESLLYFHIRFWRLPF